MRAAVIPTAGIYRTVQHLWPVFPHCTLQTMNLSIVSLLGWFTTCAAAQCHAYGDITHASCYIRGCDGGSTSLCGSWLNRCSSQASVQHHRHHDPMVSHPATSCLSLTSVAECTMHTSCMFSYRTQWTGIFPASFFRASSNSHTLSMISPFSLHVLSLSSLSPSVSLRMECKSKISRVCHGRAVESSEVSAERLLQ